MAKQTKVIYIDDLDGSEAAGTMKFGIDGDAYEIDLSVAHQKELREAIAKFQEAATRLGRYSVGASNRGRWTSLSDRAERPRAAVDREQNKAIREWAERSGKRVSPRGRIPAAIVEEYNKAHAK